MNTQVSIDMGRHPLAASPALRTWIAHQWQKAIAQYQPWLQHSRLSLRDINGPRGGEGFQGRAVVHCAEGSPIIIDERGVEPRATIRRLLERLHSNVLRHINDDNTRHRGQRKTLRRPSLAMAPSHH